MEHVAIAREGTVRTTAPIMERVRRTEIVSVLLASMANPSGRDRTVLNEFVLKILLGWEKSLGRITYTPGWNALIKGSVIEPRVLVSALPVMKVSRVNAQCVTATSEEFVGHKSISQPRQIACMMFHGTP